MSTFIFPWLIGEVRRGTMHRYRFRAQGLKTHTIIHAYIHLNIRAEKHG